MARDAKVVPKNVYDEHGGKYFRYGQRSMKSIDKRLSVHHIGGRGGSRAFPLLSRFEKDIVNVLYEADSDCVAEIEEENRLLESELHVLPYCLGDACKSGCFNINLNPFTSSLYDPSLDYGSYYSFTDGCDHLWSEDTTAIEKRHVELVTIDHIFSSGSISVPPPDFLSIDTQGSEYDILQGAKETLKSSVVALVIEAEFHAIYKDQKLFGDLTNLLSGQGFDFARFLDLSEACPFRAGIGFRGEGFHLSADALFLRRIDNIDGDELRRYIMLRKLAFIAIVLNQFEYGLECLRRSKDLARHPWITEGWEGLTYYKFLRDLEEQIERTPMVFPETFTSKCTVEPSRAHFESSADFSSPGRMRSIAELSHQIPFLFWGLKHVRRLLTRMLPTINKTILFMTWNVFRRRSRVEAVLLNYGLANQAKILMRKRLTTKTRIIKSRFFTNS